MYPLLRSEAGSHSGDDGDEVPPVPIPNTEVKLVRGESTWHIAPGRITRCRISKKTQSQLCCGCVFFCDLIFYPPGRGRTNEAFHSTTDTRCACRS